MARSVQLSPSENPPIYVCKGKGCRKSEYTRSLEGCLSEHGQVIQVKCQKICKGPVVGVEVNGSIEWFKKLRSQKAQNQLVELLLKGRLAGSLSERIANKRRGKIRGDVPMAAK